MGRKDERQAAKALKAVSRMAGEENILDIIKRLDEEPEAAAAAGSAAAVMSPRLSCTFVALRGGAFVLFGGEYYDAKVCKVFNDLYRYTPQKEDAWKLYRAKPAPKPRVGHAASLFNDNDLYVFGGEYATSSQFYHFKDFWRLNTKAMTWEDLTPALTEKSHSKKTKSSKSGASDYPSARSGHRMTVSRSNIFLFGGFHDNGRDSRYHSDLYVYWPASNTWKHVPYTPGKPSPSGRSAAVVAGNNDGLLVSGGYCKVKENDHGILGSVCDDMWWLDLKPFHEHYATASSSGTPPNVVWEKLKRKAIARSALGFVQHKNSVYAFGGVFDKDDGGLSFKMSYFFNDVWMLDLGKKTWNRLKIGPKDEAALQRVFTVKRKVLYESLVDSKVLAAAMQATDEKKSKLRVTRRVLIGVEPSGEPLPRMNPCVEVKDNHLWIFGGMLEIGSRTLVLDDTWKLNLKSLNWTLVDAGVYWKSWKDEDAVESEQEEDADSEASETSQSSNESDSASESSDSDDLTGDDSDADSASDSTV